MILDEDSNNTLSYQMDRKEVFSASEFRINCMFRVISFKPSNTYNNDM